MTYAQRPPQAVLVDTYAVIAELSDTISPKGRWVMEAVRTGRTRGVIHYLIAYELYYLYGKGMLPFESPEELEEFISSYFYMKPLTSFEANKAARIKLLAEAMLGEESRALSLSDATTLAIAALDNLPIVSGDPVLMKMSSFVGVKVIW